MKTILTQDCTVDGVARVKGDDVSDCKPRTIEKLIKRNLASLKKPPPRKKVVTNAD